jgi:hypothetical protein
VLLIVLRSYFEVVRGFGSYIFLVRGLAGVKGVNVEFDERKIE